MKLKPLLLGVTLLVLAGAVAHWLTRPPAALPDDARTGQPLLGADAANQTAALTVTAQGHTVELVQSHPGQWTVPSYHDLPADFKKVAAFVSELANAKIRRFVTGRAERIARLELQDRIRLRDQAGTSLLDLTLGKTAETGGRFVRYGTEPKAYLADGPAWLDAEPKNWADKTLLTLTPNEIKSVRVEFPDGTKFTAVISAAGQPFTPEHPAAGKEFDAAKVDALLQELSHLNWSDTAEPAAPVVVAAQAHRQTIILTNQGGRTWTIAVGRKPEEKPAEPEKTGATPAKAAPTIPAGPVYVHISDSDPAAPVNAWMQRRAFEIPAWVFERLPAKADDFWRTPAAPARP